jgi:predicted nucleic acid-binding protein
MVSAPVFLDTGYLVALLNRRDSMHAQARSLARTWEKNRRRALTTDAVLIELANFFARSPLRMLAIASIRRMRTSSAVAVEPLASPLLDRGEARYAAHTDKGWSLTDCLSMEVMLEKGSSEAATADHHFEQAGFVVLMEPGRSGSP